MGYIMISLVGGGGYISEKLYIFLCNISGKTNYSCIFELSIDEWLIAYEVKQRVNYRSRSISCF
jgi:hypothetical protein